IPSWVVENVSLIVFDALVLILVIGLALYVFRKCYDDNPVAEDTHPMKSVFRSDLETAEPV
ncbi:hypothetical protein AAVH_43446, partial [Aphelenchoides avenae]